MNDILVAKRVNKKVMLDKHNELHILKDVQLTIKKGEFISFMGPSGSGKSTLLYNISGMDRMTSGQITFMGTMLGQLDEEQLAEIRLHHMGFIFQDIHLLKNLSIIDNIVFHTLVSQQFDKKDAYEKAKNLLKITGIDYLANNRITQASGGQLQRVGICRALMNDPEIIFGDEPTGALDSKAAKEILEILARINAQGTTVVLVTHDMKVAAKTERVLFMEDGKIISEKRLGKPQRNDDSKLREEIIMNWFMENEQKPL